ncbi:MAG: type II toxin-antitoxin system Phd/YefM family antitoxin [Armatimonadetes bacterium]|nr:type II toxin-antitoxin system Phd/YefM family antitoxin [Armatimonadota bacterium]
MITIEIAGRGPAWGEFLEQARRNPVLLTRNGAPAAVVTSVEGLDLEHILTASSAEFWQMIAERRRDRTVPLTEARSALGL